MDSQQSRRLCRRLPTISFICHVVQLSEHLTMTSSNELPAASDAYAMNVYDKRLLSTLMTETAILGDCTISRLSSNFSAGTIWHFIIL